MPCHMEDGEELVVETMRHSFDQFVLDAVREAVRWYFEPFVFLASGFWKSIVLGPLALAEAVASIRNVRLNRAFRHSKEHRFQAARARNLTTKKTLMNFERRNIESWPEGSLTWSTQFNDLRCSPSLGKDEHSTIEPLLREMKGLALFQYQSVIRDTDLANHPTLQRVLASNEGGVQESVKDGSFVLHLRDSAESFSDVNEQIGVHRAFPERLSNGRESLKAIDAFVDAHHIPVAVNQIPLDYFFQRLLLRVLDSSHLNAPQKELLRNALDIAEEKRGNGPLRFGHIYEYLVRTQGLKPQTGLIQWCRTAHSLAMPSAIGLPISAADGDLTPGRVGVVLGHAALEIDNLDDPAQWLEFYPKQILGEDMLDVLDFHQIRVLRAEGNNIGYFRAITRAHAQLRSSGFRSTHFRDAYRDYLGKLEEYLLMIGHVHDAELFPWQQILAQERVDLVELRQRALGWTVPVLIGAGLTFVTLNIIPTGMSIAAEALVARGVDKLIQLRQQRKPVPLKQLLQGTSVVPPSPRTNAQKKLEADEQDG